MTKLTKKDYFNMILGVVSASDVENKIALIDFINKEIALLNKKSASRKNTPTQEVNKDIISTIIDILTQSSDPMTIGQLMEDSRLATYPDKVDGTEIIKKMTPQKLTSLVTKLKKDGTVVRTEVKKVAYFSINKD